MCCRSPHRAAAARASRGRPSPRKKWAYEPKCDGFRAIAFVDGDELFIQSRNGKPLARYFPELSFPRGRYVLDGEIVIGAATGLRDAQTAHPSGGFADRAARSERRRRGTSRSTCSRCGDESLLDKPFAERRRALEAIDDIEA